MAITHYTLVYGVLIISAFLESSARPLTSLQLMVSISGPREECVLSVLFVTRLLVLFVYMIVKCFGVSVGNSLGRMRVRATLRFATQNNLNRLKL